MIIESLPDDVLLLIFSFYVDRAQDEERWPGERIEEWHALVHVCRRWRSVVFASPRHLRLRLVCTMRRSVEEMNDIWPALPIVIRTNHDDPRAWVDERTHNMITALQLNDRVSEISFRGVPDEILKIFAAVMEEPFPFLTSLRISSSPESRSVLPDFFLGGSAPCLRSLHLDYVKFSALRKLLSSTSDLRKLSFRLISGFRYISPRAMVSCLSATTRLRSLHLDFGLASSYRKQEGRRLAPSTRIVLPALTHFSWTGTSRYLNNLLARIDAPQLYSMEMTFDSGFMAESPEIALFIGRTERFKEPYRANISIDPHVAELMLIFSLRTQTVHYPSLKFVVDYPPVWPLSYLVHSYRSSFLPLSAAERLDILSQRSTANTEWLELLGLFIAVKDLHVSGEVAIHIMQALQELSVERATEVLPALHNLFIEGLEPSGPLREAVEQFAATRQLAGHPVAVRPWTASKVWE